MALRDSLERARATMMGENLDPGRAIARTPATVAFTSARKEDVDRELRVQRDERRKSQPTGRINEEDVRRGVLETRASIFNVGAANESKARGSWRKALSSVRSAKRGAALSDVNPLEWTDVDGLFAYYDSIYFESKLNGRVTFSWHASPSHRNDDESEDMGEKAKLDSLFKYCLCSDVPKWWHGANPRQLCVGVCCVIEKRASQYSRVAHLRMPDVLRRFKMTQMTKEALLHGMTHAYLFVTGHTKEDAAFNAHDEEFKRLTYKLNYDFMIADAYRPQDKGYAIRWFDRAIEASAAATTSSDPLSSSMAVASARPTKDVASSVKSQLFKNSVVDVLTPEHYKLLYFISKHSRLAEKATDKERWIRYLHIMVLVYEAILAGVFDYDYSPYGEEVGSKRMMLNISQEARDNLDDLVEAGMVRSLRMSTSNGKSTMAYQPSKKGLEYMRQGSISREDKELCDEFMYDPRGSLLKVVFEEKTETFKLVSDEGFNIDSTVTESEDVSYVCSPYLCRQFMKSASRPLSSYAYRASESIRGLSSIADDLDVQLSMSRVIVLIGDWIPTSCTQITELSQSLGVSDRNKGGYYSSEVDRASTDTCLEIPVGLTRISISSANAAQYCNVEAEVEYPEAAGITQIESFGLRFAREGDLVCGMKIESVMTKILNDIPVDWLSRVVADLQVDSSKLTASMTSLYQRNVLETVYDGDFANRPKFALYLAETISPKLSARHYLDGDSIEAEVKQLIGDTHYALDVSDSDVIIIGAGGIIFAGPDCARHETLLMAFCLLRARENFCTVLYQKLSTMKEELRNLQMILERVHDEPDTLRRAQVSLAETNTNLYRLGEAIRHMEVASETPIIQFGESVEPETPITGTTMYYALNTKSSKRLQHALATDVLESTIAKRVKGCVKHYSANQEFLRTLQAQAKEVMRDNRAKTIATTRATLDQSREFMEHDAGGDRQSQRVLCALFIGLLAFRILDRLVGSSFTIPESVSFVTKNFRYPLMWDMNVPWILLSLGTWLMIAAGCAFARRVYVDRRDGFIDSTTSSTRRLCVNTLLRYLKLKEEVTYQDIFATEGTQVTQITYVEVPWGIFDTYRASVTLTVDTMRGRLLKTRIRISKSKSLPGKLFPNELHELLVADLELNGVIVDGEGNEKLRKAAQHRAQPKILLVQALGEVGVREITLTDSTLESLRATIAAKFCYRMKNVIRMSLVQHVSPNVTDEEIITTNSAVERLREYARINVVFFGRPKPKMARYLRQVTERAERQRFLDERRRLFQKKFGRRRKNMGTVAENYPESDDEAIDGF